MSVANSRSGRALLEAIAGFHGEHGQNPAHEPIVSQLRRVMADVHRGSSSEPGDSPGQREAKTAAFQKEIASERQHDGGDGQTRSNQPGPPAHHGQDNEHPVIHEGDGRNDHLSGSTVQHTAGNVRSNLPGPGMAAGSGEIRRIAAEREQSRPDSHMADRQNRGDNNRRSEPPGAGFPPAGRVGDAPQPAPRPGAGGPPGPSSANSPAAEPVPPRVGQSADPFVRAGVQAKQRMRQGR